MHHFDGTVHKLLNHLQACFVLFECISYKNYDTDINVPFPVPASLPITIANKTLIVSPLSPPLVCRAVLLVSL